MKAIAEVDRQPNNGYILLIYKIKFEKRPVSLNVYACGPGVPS